MIRCWVPFLLSFLVLSCGCSRSVEWFDSRDRAEPLIKRARVKRSEGDIDGAIALYREALETDQRMALASLDLALLLHDEKKDYMGAVCLYTRYLDARPETDKKEMIRKRRELAIQSFTATLAPPVRTSGSAAISESSSGTRKENTELAAVRQQLRIEQESARNAIARAEELVEKNNELQSTVRRMQGELDQLQAVSSAAMSLSPKEERRPDSRPARKRTYEVMPGDSLSSIAAAVYGEGAKWRTIYEANQGILGNSQKLRVGQVLVIP